MPFNLLLLPLLGGYIFALKFNKSRYYLIRADKERMLILASCVGLVLIAVSWAIHLLFAFLIPCHPDQLCVPLWWRETVGMDYSGISVAALLLGACAWWPLNRWVFKDIEYEIDKVLEKDCDPFELLLRNSQKNTTPLAVTMKNGKVYIGWVNHDFNPGTETKYISLMPIESGYRLPDTKRLIRTVDYSKTLQDIRSRRNEVIEQLKILSADDEHISEKRQLLIELEILNIESTAFTIVLPVSEIVSANLFDTRIHDDYFAIIQPQMTP